MTEYDVQFLDPQKIKFLHTVQEPTQAIPFMDFDFEEQGNPRTLACLAYSFERKFFYGQIRQSETDDGMLDLVGDATNHQVDVLLAILPQERKDRIAELQAFFDENGSFPSLSQPRI